MNPLLKLWQYSDKTLLCLAIVLSSLGLVMVASSSIDFAGLKYQNVIYFSARQSVFVVIAFIVGTMAFMIPTKHWLQFGWLYLMLAFVLLIIVLLPGIGREVNGSKRWISLGLINLQASELAKLFILVYMAGYLVRRREEVKHRWRGFLKPVSVLVLAIILLLEEPDFGSAVVMIFAVLGVIFLAGLGLPQFISLIFAALISVTVMAMSSSYRLERLKCFIDPWQEAHRYDCGYQLTQSLIAFGRGEWFGLGLGNSIQKQFYLPEAHTDFVFAIIAEELGFIGAALTLALFVFMIAKMFLLARRLERQDSLFSAYMTYGIALMISAQVFINIGVNIGLLPTKGLTLPLLSYGGSSLIVSFIMLGIVLRIGAEASIPQKTRKSKKSGRSRGLPK